MSVTLGNDLQLKQKTMIKELLEPLVPERFRTDGRYRNGQVRIINALPGRKIQGVHTPEIRNLAKKLAAREDCRDILRGFEQEESSCRGSLTHEEMTVWGFMISYMKCSLDERLEYLRRFVPQIDNWAVCDMFDGSAKWVMRKLSVNPSSSLGRRLPEIAEKRGKTVGELTVRDILWEDLCRYFASDREFEVRFAVVMSMSYYLDENWLPLVFAQIDALDFGKIKSEYVSAKQARKADHCAGICGDRAGDVTENSTDIPANSGISGKGVALGEPPYYVRMGVAWLLATALVKFPGETRRYAGSANLPDDVKKLYVRKARESFRTRDVSPF